MKKVAIFSKGSLGPIAICFLVGWWFGGQANLLFRKELCTKWLTEKLANPIFCTSKWVWTTIVFFFPWWKTPRVVLSLTIIHFTIRVHIIRLRVHIIRLRVHSVPTSSPVSNCVIVRITLEDISGLDNNSTKYGRTTRKVYFEGNPNGKETERRWGIFIRIK